MKLVGLPPATGLIRLRFDREPQIHCTDIRSAEEHPNIQASPAKNRQDSMGTTGMQAVEIFTLTLLMIFAPLAYGATSRWAFCVTLGLALIALSSMILRRLWQATLPLPRSSLDYPIIALLFLSAGSWIVSIYRDATVWAVLRLLLYVSVYYLTLDIVSSRKQTQWMVMLLVGMGTAVSFTGLVEYSGAPFPGFWKTGNPWALDGPFVNKNHLAGYLQMTFALGLGVFTYRSMSGTVVWVTSLGLILIALCLSLSRGGWIGAFIAVEFMLVSFLLRKKVSRIKTAGIATVLLGVVGLTLLASNPMIERMQTLQDMDEASIWGGRLAAWKGCVEIIEKSPLCGMGLGTFPWSFTRVRPQGLTSRWIEAHNDYLQIVSEMGLPVLVPLIWGIILIFKEGLLSFWRTPSRLWAGVSLGALGGILAILVHSVSDFNLQITSNGMVFSCLVGLVLASRTSLKAQ